MSKFKVGDKVLCKDPLDTLSIDKVYTVAKITAVNKEILIDLVGEPYSYLEFRFKLYEEKSNDYSEIANPPKGHPMPATKLDYIEENLFAIETECKKAMFDWPEFHSAHEGFAVLKEEVDELWDCVKLNPKKRDMLKMRNEAVQVAAMALRFLTEVCNNKPNN